MLQKEVEMRFVVAAIVLAAVSLGDSAQVASVSYWLLLKEDGHTWCGYANMDRFISDLKEQQTTETARVTYSSDKLTEVTYQVEPESGDWMIVDKYTPSKDGLVLRRANLLTQDNIQVIQETSIHGGKIDPFRVISTATLDGKKVEGSSSLDLPNVSVRANLSEMPFVDVVADMRRQSILKLCKTF
jgi:hypothetical protein